MSITILASEALALKRCSNLAACVYVGLVRLADRAQILGPRRDLLKQLSGLIGPVQAYGRPLQFGELERELRELEFANVVTQGDERGVLAVTLLLRVEGA